MARLIESALIVAILGAGQRAERQNEGLTPWLKATRALDHDRQAATQLIEREAFRALFAYGGTLEALDRGSVSNVDRNC